MDTQLLSLERGLAFITIVFIFFFIIIIELLIQILKAINKNYISKNKEQDIINLLDKEVIYKISENINEINKSR